MNETALVSRPQVTSSTLAPAAPKMSIANLDFYYGKFHALKNVNLDIAERRVTAFIGPSGCGKSTLLRTLNRMYSLYPGQRATGEIRFNGQNVLESGVDLNMLRAKVGHGVPEADAVPDVDLRQHRVRRAAVREPRPAGDGRARRMGADQGGDVGRSEGQAEAERDGAVGRPAAAAVHRARGLGQAGSAAARRADFGARSDFDGEDRGADHASSRPTTRSPS